ncbi:MAG: indolepyruvate oxidoreductase subunit beta family protein [Hoeflea sp.]|uniref:indolepyruvate oxidoreductase subunit beta family protein n=1 Tax=Hoeflea sp. TaxID=1940281 RepID=UPI001DC7F789|nr:indolepyruvate oxidoreductase subunit beta family protein [Hoeflea sp.]MBU4528741.1 indolepyruvate oxidoreductase subunit beta family protein [Alphaproteobacteria bacterium]MBU4545932.1 indolepyruvate oxidoreductase subunit beta family protein [Alphaproteobacteria bacterium]MBU4549875.1 indolepyruvate oxidoreductase subunit beta family protein [Alphaproteobacteria bacterium]MBV1725872.1 indolepyruvate oxidoreductase subunit beta family protein [Hoeflea sp.]MBV1762597.1 indolepyruvate oxidor
MTHSAFTPKPQGPALDQIIKLAIMAVGGQGGGVLTNWVEDCARSNGYAVQATSVAGVAQRTGATIYYMEMAPMQDRAPVFSLLPAAGDVDILVAAEMMEAGRAIMRGFVTPDRTTLIASSHRALAVSEKMVPGDGIADSQEVIAAAEIAARRFIAFDMEKMAVDAGSMISASLFGALAGSGALPFERSSFEAAIKASGRGVEASLRAFGAGFEAAAVGTVETPRSVRIKTSPGAPSGPKNLVDQWNALEARATSLPAPVRDMARSGLRAVVDFQDLAYGRDYLERIDTVLAEDDPAKGYELTLEAAKYIAKAMAYDDVFRVADLKTRGSRFARVRSEIAPAKGAQMKLTEFMHPRAEEIVGMMPSRLGRRLSASERAMRVIDRLVNKGRRLRTDRLLPFAQLYVLGGLRKYRRGTLRHAIETEHLENWLAQALSYRRIDYALGVETLRNRRLVKGYSDTHARGLSKFDRVMDGVALLAGRDDAAHWCRLLREAALADEKGEQLEGALKTVRSFASQAETTLPN